MIRGNRSEVWPDRAVPWFARQSVHDLRIGDPARRAVRAHQSPVEDSMGVTAGHKPLKPDLARRIDGGAGHDGGGVRSAAIVFVVALVVRLLYLMEARGFPTFLVPLIDS